MNLVRPWLASTCSLSPRSGSSNQTPPAVRFPSDGSLGSVSRPPPTPPTLFNHGVPAMYRWHLFLSSLFFSRRNKKTTGGRGSRGPPPPPPPLLYHFLNTRACSRACRGGQLSLSNAQRRCLVPRCTACCKGAAWAPCEWAGLNMGLSGICPSGQLQYQQWLRQSDGWLCTGELPCVIPKANIAFQTTGVEDSVYQLDDD